MWHIVSTVLIYPNIAGKPSLLFEHILPWPHPSHLNTNWKRPSSRGQFASFRSFESADRVQEVVHALKPSRTFRAAFSVPLWSWPKITCYILLEWQLAKWDFHKCHLVCFISAQVKCWLARKTIICFVEISYPTVIADQSVERNIVRFSVWPTSHTYFPRLIVQ